MKIEKINENQIRCTLTKEDLADRQIRLSELAYGSDKARALFKDMIAQAKSEFGFNADDIPLMVEAIPVSAESIILVITKCEFPDELDTRFSRFSEPNPDLLGEIIPTEDKPPMQGASDIVDMYRKAYEKFAKEQNSDHSEDKQEKNTVPSNAKEENSASGVTREEIMENLKSAGAIALKELMKKVGIEVPEELRDLACIYEFNNLDKAITLAHILNERFDAKSEMYKVPEDNKFLLVLYNGAQNPQDFNRYCNIAAEYGKNRPYRKSLIAYLKEHKCMIMGDSAIQQLNELY